MAEAGGYGDHHRKMFGRLDNQRGSRRDGGERGGEGAVPCLPKKTKSNHADLNENFKQSVHSMRDILDDMIGRRRHYSLVPTVLSVLGDLVNSMVKSAENGNVMKDDAFALMELYLKFVKNIPSEEVKKNLSTIAIHLHNLLTIALSLKSDDAINSVAEIMKLVIVSHADELKEKLRYIQFLNRREIKPLGSVCDILDHAFHKYQTDPKDGIIAWTTEAATTREPELKMLFLEFATQLIEQNYTHLFHPSQLIPQWITEVVENLMKDIKHPDPSVRFAVSHCLGAIGAIDPGRFEIIPTAREDDDAEIIHWDVDSPLFMTAITRRIGRLARAIGSSKGHLEMVYTTRELMKEPELQRLMAFDNAEEVGDEIDAVYRKLFESQLQEEPIQGHEGEQEIIFSSNVTYEGWLIRWSRKLLSLMNKNSKKYKILEPLVRIFKHDLHFAESLLPCIVFNFLCGDDDIKFFDKEKAVVNELATVVQSVIPNAFRTPEPNISTFDNSSFQDGKVTVTKPVMSDIQHRCSYQIFIMFDKFEEWKAGLVNMNKTYVLDQLLANVTKFNLSYLAYSCRAYARALKYIEQYIKENTTTKQIDVIINGSPEDDCVIIDPPRTFTNSDLEKCYELLQKIYIALDEPDGVEGVSAKRMSSPKLMEQVLTHEAANRLHDALSRCEQGITKEPESCDLHKKRLRCLMSLGMYDNAYRVARDLSRIHPSKEDSWKSKITPFIVEAGWKLSKWDELDEIFKDSHRKNEPHKKILETNMNMNIGQLLVRLHQRDKKAFDEVFTHIHIKGTATISAMATETGAYTRSYQELTRFQMFTDIDRAAAVFCGLSRNPAIPLLPEHVVNMKDLEELRHTWDIRNSLVMESSQSLEPILHLQRILFSSFLPENPSRYNGADRSVTERRYLVEAEAELWLKSAKLARKSGNQTKAELCILAVSDLFNGPKKPASVNIDLMSRFIVESAKHNFSKENLDSKFNAVRELTRSIRKYFRKSLESLNLRNGTNRSDHLSSFGGSSTGSSLMDEDNEEEPMDTDDTTDMLIRRATARAMLVKTKFVEELQTQSVQKLINQYDQVIQVDRRWGKPVFSLAKLYDQLAPRASTNDERVVNMKFAMIFYYKSLILSTRYTEEALPRLIELFCNIGLFDFWYTSLVKQRESEQKGKGKGRCVDFENEILMKTIKDSFQYVKEKIMSENRILKQIPSYVLYTCFTQLMSRVSHLHDDVMDSLKNIISHVMRQHPHQTLWMFMGHEMDTTNERKNKVCNDIVLMTTVKDRKFGKIASDMKAIAELFKRFAQEVEIKGKKISGDQRLKIFASGVKLKDHLAKLDIEVIVPVKKCMRVNMPLCDFATGNLEDFVPFPPENRVCIRGIEDDVHIYGSLAKPKKVILRGNNGQKYPVIVKPKDDMRRDARTMEYLDVVNRILLKDPETRKRQLKMRTFQITPLGSESGLIECLEGLTDLKSLLLKQYDGRNNGPKPFEHNKIGIYYKNFFPGDIAKMSEDDRRRKDLLNNYRKVSEAYNPPVFGQYFIKHFKDAHQWHTARNNFIRSVAVSSIVGYILGLGDRHLENILFDTNTGEVIHIDFNILFNAGEGLQVPEVVPFRLTRNLIDAMGSTGYEGHFRKTAEAVLRVMRSHKDSLLAVLKPFVLDHDPEYIKQYCKAQSMTRRKSEQTTFEQIVKQKFDETIKLKGAAAGNEMEDIVGLEHFAPGVRDQIADIEARLKGVDHRLESRQYRKSDLPDEGQARMPLSVAGQVDALIISATDQYNLSAMFVGWGSFW